MMVRGLLFVPHAAVPEADSNGLLVNHIAGC
jgi:hypothetical protein